MHNACKIVETRDQRPETRDQRPRTRSQKRKTTVTTEAAIAAYQSVARPEHTSIARLINRVSEEYKRPRLLTTVFPLHPRPSIRLRRTAVLNRIHISEGILLLFKPKIHTSRNEICIWPLYLDSTSRKSSKAAIQNRTQMR